MASVAEAGPRTEVGRWIGFAGRSLVTRLALLVLAFLTVPIILYAEFRNAEETKSLLLLEAIRDKGLVVARALKETLNRADPAAYTGLGDELTRYAVGNVALKLLFRPQDPATEVGFFYVAASPAIAADQLERERQYLAQVGILERVNASCVGDLAVAVRLDLPDGRSELLTSITPLKTTAGCWALIAASHLDTPRDKRLGAPYWRLPEVQLALAVYIGLALLVLALFLDLWRSLHRFGRMARAVGQRRSDSQFTDEVTVPELAPVASAFDQMVARLRGAAAHLRQVAEDTAHAYKQPLGTIRQALEPLRRRDPTQDPRGDRAIRAIEASLDRLDNLVAAARRLDDVTADTLDPPRERIDVAAMLRQVATSYSQTLTAEGPRIAVDVVTPAVVVGGTELLELALENLVENALSFSPSLSTVRLRLTREGRYAVVTVEDSGPGVPPDVLPRIFERYFSMRPTGHTTHFGLGLWIVKRNIEAIGGRVSAANRPTGGFAISLRLPIA
jgi:two-component system, OmpR family, sensor histidine kinase ChvG